MLTHHIHLFIAVAPSSSNHPNNTSSTHLSCQVIIRDSNHSSFKYAVTAVPSEEKRGEGNRTDGPST